MTCDGGEVLNGRCTSCGAVGGTDGRHPCLPEEAPVRRRKASKSHRGESMEIIRLRALLVEEQKRRRELEEELAQVERDAVDARLPTLGENELTIQLAEALTTSAERGVRIRELLEQLEILTAERNWFQVELEKFKGDGSSSLPPVDPILRENIRRLRAWWSAVAIARRTHQDPPPSPDLLYDVDHCRECLHDKHPGRTCSESDALGREGSCGCSGESNPGKTGCVAHNGVSGGGRR